MNQQTVIIIGGGLGGLFTGAPLTKEGFNVTVLEKNAAAGGGLQTFRRGGLVFETGMHILGGLRPGGSLQKICSYLGIYDRLSLRAVDHDCMDSITYLRDGKTYRIPEGREAFTNYFISEFPDEAEGIRQYVDALYRLANEVDFFYLRSAGNELFSHSEQFLWAASELIAYYIKDMRLRDVLAYMNPMYGGVEDHTPAFIHALINVLYISGQDRFIGGSQQMAQLLVQLIEEGGGRVVTARRVTAFHIDDNRCCTAVTTADGSSFHADIFIAAIHPQQLVKLVGNGGFPRSYRSRVASIPNTYSAFSVYIKLRPEAFPYINHTCYFQDDYGYVWHHGDYAVGDQQWPHGFMFMTPPEKHQGPFATKMVINCLMPFSAVERWAETTTGRRGADYELWKEKQAELIFSRMEQLYPCFRSSVEQWWTSSPLTIRDYYGEPDGALYGVRKDCRDIMLSQLPVCTKVSNLLLTGQNINLHGICGVPLTAVGTVEAIIGRNMLIDKINKCYNSNNGKD
jgi:all-trans-retinol 13,14-reductase